MNASVKLRPGAEAVAERGWLSAHKWLILRRLSQIGILALFLIGPLAGVWIVKGNLAYSLTLGVLPLTDPYVLAQSLLTGHIPEKLAIIGAAVVLTFYFLAGGRLYCAWVCPVNPVTDAAAWLRDKLGFRGSAHISRRIRYWVLATTFIVALLSGVIAWELINPVSMLHRSLIFGFGTAWAIVLAVFLFDLLISRNGWCGHVCPVGAFYSLLGKWSLLRVAAVKRGDCNDCMDCYAVCPEPHVIKPTLKGQGKGIGPTILSPNCTNCGRCIDVCSKGVFRFGMRGVSATR